MLHLCKLLRERAAGCASFLLRTDATFAITVAAQPALCGAQLIVQRKAGRIAKAVPLDCPPQQFGARAVRSSDLRKGLPLPQPKPDVLLDVE
jgi:hypothetical protein